MLSWLSRVGRVDLPDIKRISLLQALLLAGIAWYIHRIINFYIAYQVRLSTLFPTFSLHSSFVLAAWRLFISHNFKFVFSYVSILSLVIDSIQYGLFSSSRQIYTQSIFAKFTKRTLARSFLLILTVRQSLWDSSWMLSCSKVAK